jgi:hypothetical protein
MLLENVRCNVWHMSLSFVSSLSAADNGVPKTLAISTLRPRVMHLSGSKVTITILCSGLKDANKTRANFRFQYRAPVMSYTETVI